MNPDYNPVDALTIAPSAVERKPLPRGSYSKIARRIRRSPQHVRAVALGLKTSARVVAAIEKFRAQLEQNERQNVA